MHHNIKIAQHYDIISKEFDDSRVRIWNNVQQFIKKGGDRRLLDVGVGNGKNIQFAQQYGYKCVGIDISDNLLKICKNKGLDVHACDMIDLTTHHFGLFDDILCIASLHHLENIEEQKNAIEKMYLCLNNSGRLLVSTWSYESIQTGEKSMYRDFEIGPNIVKWMSKTKEYQVDRFYYIHNYETFNEMFDAIL